jgi:tRNA (guanosine-2'-O-)-methyltransferase
MMEFDPSALNPAAKTALADHLATFISENKRDKIEEILVHRTRYLTVALEDIYQTQNASAVVRSCECFGIQDVYVIENHNPFKLNKDVAQGASKWVDLHRYGPPEVNAHSPRTDHTRACLEHLKACGFRLVATSPDHSSNTINDLPLDQPLALLFGSEEPGLTSTALEMADMRTSIPMYGFTQSYNLSVSVALALQSLTSQLRASAVTWRLPEATSLDLKLRCYMKVINRGGVLAKKFLEDYA